MKPLFLALLFANIIVFAWAQWHTPTERGGAALTLSGVPTLQLASEGAQEGTPIATPVLIPAPTPAPTAQPSTEPSAAPAEQSGVLLSGVARCISLGPFRDLAEASQASSTMRTSGYAPRTRVAQGDVWAGLWVYLADLPSRAEAQRAMSLLKQRGVVDAYIMPGADQTNVISLGIFSEPQRAQRRAEEVRALGFTPTVADRTRKDTVYWIDIDLKPTDSMVSPSDFQSESGRIVRLQVVACPAGSGASG